MHSHQEATKANAIKKFNNVTELAGYIGCNTEKLQETLHSVERYCLGDLQDNFGRDFTKKPPLEPPYYIAKIQGALFHTQGGLEVDRRARVLRENGQPFPNLFAGGGAAWVFWSSRLGLFVWIGLLSATNLGRFAGESAADLVLKS